MAEFNLLYEPWIPCIDPDGRQVEYGIRDTLIKAHELKEVCDDSPLVTVAIHRLLLAILYRAYTGPRDFNDWKDIFKGGSFDKKKIIKYADKWRARFFLFSANAPFFQMKGLETKSPISVNRLSTECASGNNATLFSHSADDVATEWSPALGARQLIACQSFALGFGKSGNATINGKNEILPYSADAIALRGMNLWLQGTDLFRTLAVNLVHNEDISLPPWELDDPHRYRDRLSGKNKQVTSSMGVVDLLTWQSRLVRLQPTEKQTISQMYFTQGRSADKSPGDPMKVYRSSKKEGISALPLSSGKAAWRDAHAILTISAPGSKERRPECFNLLARAGLSSEQFLTHIVGLASAPKKAGKFLLWRHERMPVPVALLADVNLIERLGRLLENAEDAASTLNYRTRRIAKLYLAPEAESSDGRQPDKDEVTKIAKAIDPRPAYWARLEKHFFTLLENLPDDWDAESDDWKQDDLQKATNAWRGQVKEEAKKALEESIRSLGTTARAIQAVARVRTDFKEADLVPQPRKTAKAKRKSKGGRKK